MLKIFKRLKAATIKFLDDHTSQVFDINEGKLGEFPKPIIWLVYLMSANVLIQGVADVIIKVLGYTPWLVMFPWRIDFLFLTAISVLMGYQTLMGMRRRELDVTKNSVQIGLLVEIGLLIGDVFFVHQVYKSMPEALVIRFPFMFFTFINIIILGYLVHKLNLFKNQKGEWEIL